MLMLAYIIQFISLYMHVVQMSSTFSVWLVSTEDYAAASRAFREAEAEGCEPPVSLLAWLLRNVAFKDLQLAKEMLHYGLSQGMIPDVPRQPFRRRFKRLYIH